MLCFPCCVDEQPPPRRRPRIDRTQIGLPTNFQHTGHIGSGEVASGFDVHQVQTSMQSKGGYDQGSNEIKNTPTGIDLTQNNSSNGSSISGNNLSENGATTNNISSSPDQAGTIECEAGLLTS